MILNLLPKTISLATSILGGWDTIKALYELPKMATNVQHVRRLSVEDKGSG